MLSVVSIAIFFYTQVSVGSEDRNDDAAPRPSRESTKERPAVVVVKDSGSPSNDSGTIVAEEEQLHGALAARCLARSSLSLAPCCSMLPALADECETATCLGILGRGFIRSAFLLECQGSEHLPPMTVLRLTHAEMESAHAKVSDAVARQAKHASALAAAGALLPTPLAVPPTHPLALRPSFADLVADVAIPLTTPALLTNLAQSLPMCVRLATALSLFPLLDAFVEANLFPCDWQPAQLGLSIPSLSLTFLDAKSMRGARSLASALAKTPCSDDAACVVARGSCLAWQANETRIPLAEGHCDAEAGTCMSLTSRTLVHAAAHWLWLPLLSPNTKAEELVGSLDAPTGASVGHTHRALRRLWEKHGGATCVLAARDVMASVASEQLHEALSAKEDLCASQHYC
uniref:E3 ubiquitin-protein ligase n=1 Tax=Sexangularia sp. CB-2014 TaxID=1486929 RepID=A0A7S1YIR3_9EUKA